MLETVDPASFAFGATTALAFEEAVRRVIRSRLFGSDPEYKDQQQD